jgi:hypothetical protein
MADHQDVEMQPQLQIYGLLLLLRREWKYANAHLSLCFGNYVGHCVVGNENFGLSREREMEVQFGEMDLFSRSVSGPKFLWLLLYGRAI